jgi:hypothetical protein
LHLRTDRDRDCGVDFGERGFTLELADFHGFDPLDPPVSAKIRA